jgi:hypothetical protein
MSFNITTAREAVETWSIQIKKGEWITHALMRFADTENASKWVKDLERAFRTLTTQQRSDIMLLAKEVGDTVPFVGRVKNKVYGITDKTKIGEKLNIVVKKAQQAAAAAVVAAASVAVPAAAAPVASTPSATVVASSRSLAPIAKPAVATTPEARAAAEAVASVKTRVPDWTSEMQNISRIVAEIGRGTAGDTLKSSSGSSYRYKNASNTEIEYAKVVQSGEEIYWFDKPEKGARIVYRYGDGKVIGSLSVETNGKITPLKWEKFEAPYMPTPIISKK